MPTPFPGMDPYLERPGLWKDVHTAMLADLRRPLAAKLAPKYYIALEERTYLLEANELALVGEPDIAAIKRDSPRGGVAVRTQPMTNGLAMPEPVVVELPLSEEVRERYLEVRLAADHRVITVIELLSPANKRTGEGRAQYEKKRQKVLDSSTHFVEIDLLRGGTPMAMTHQPEDSHYRILISRSEQRPKGLLYAFSVRDVIPKFYLPLQKGDDEPLIDLQNLLHTLYDDVRYDLRISYKEEPTPRLDKKDVTWSNQLLIGAGLR